MKRLLPAVLIVAFGCGGGDSGGQAGGAAGEGQEAPAAAMPAGGATISGTVKFTGTPPTNPTIDMAEEPSCRDNYTGTVRDPVVAVNSGNLANVAIYVTSGLPEGGSYPAPSNGPELDQEGCLYHPRVVMAMVNQPITIRNSDPVLHNIKAVPKTNRGFNISQPSEGMETERTFPRAEMAIPVECNVHGWMHARVFVMDNPYYAATGEDGSFTIQGLPAGTYTLEAWHETLGTQTATVTVAEDASETVTFTFSG